MPDINVLIKPASGMCNLRCHYCFYHDETRNREIESYGMMSEETLEQVIKKTIDFADTSCTIAYQGGEPTMRGLDFFQRSMEFQKKYNNKNLRISNAIQTNGLLLDEKWAAFFAEHNFLVGISLDGIPYTHDAFRKDGAGNGTFEKVMAAIRLLEQHHVEFNILTVVHARTAKKIPQIYSFYRDCGFHYLQFIPCMNPLGRETERFPYTLTPEVYGHFLKTLFDLWYQDLKAGRFVHIQLFESYIKMLLLMQPDVCGMTGICSCQHVIEADGEVYPCDFYVLDAYKLGNLNKLSFEEIQDKRKELRFIEQSAVMHEDCKGCKYMPICRGGCYRYRAPKHYFCTAYYDFFEYTIKRLEEAAGIYAVRFQSSAEYFPKHS